MTQPWRSGAAARNRSALSTALAVPTVLVLLFDEQRAAGTNQAADAFLGYLLGFLVMQCWPLITFAVARLLDAQVPLVIVGYGPIVWRRVGPSRVTLVRTLPLAFGFRHVPGREHFGRDLRLLLEVRLLGPLLPACVLAVFLPGHATVSMLAMVLYGVLNLGLRKDPGSGRRQFSRVFVHATPERDRALFDPRAGDHMNAAQALFFGDLATLHELLPVLRANAWPPAAAAALEASLHEVRGEYETAFHALADLPPEAAPLKGLEEARLRLVDAERDPAMAGQAVAAAQAYLDARPPAVNRDTYSTVLALLRVETGNPAEARPSAQAQFERARDPLSLADALCTRARVEAALGQLDQAGRTLRQAHAYAPWYARVTIVRARLESGVAARLAADRSASDATPFTEPAGRDTLDDPWAAPSA